MLYAIPLIKNRYESMHKVEKKIADYILKTPASVPNMTVAELAADLEVAPSSVLRFCQTLGFTGYTDFRLSLAAVRHEGEPLAGRVSAGDDTKEICRKVFQSHRKTLSDTMKLLNYDALKRAVELIGEAERVEVYGVGTSSTLAWDFYYRMMRIGRNVYCVTDPHVMRVSASKLGERCVAFGISHTGRTIDTIDALRIAKDGKAGVVCLTSHGNSPICAISDVALTVYSDEIKEIVEAVSARIAHVAVLDTICTCLAVANYDKAQENLIAANKILANLRI